MVFIFKKNEIERERENGCVVIVVVVVVVWCSLFEKKFLNKKKYPLR